jgi:hypothetical protein
VHHRDRAAAIDRVLAPRGSIRSLDAIDPM